MAPPKKLAVPMGWSVAGFALGMSEKRLIFDANVDDLVDYETPEPKFRRFSSNAGAKSATDQLIASISPVRSF